MLSGGVARMARQGGASSVHRYVQTRVCSLWEDVAILSLYVWHDVMCRVCIEECL